MRSRRSPRPSEPRPRGPHPTESLSPLFVDLYELTMLQSYVERGMNGVATFALTLRQQPTDWGVLVAAGTAAAVDAILAHRFEAPALAALGRTGLFCAGFLAELERLRFTGSVRAVPEGCPVFAGEPLLEVTAPLPQAQLFETLLINQVQLPTLAASKAARCVAAAAGRQVVDFAMRRAHGAEAARHVARSASLAGMAGTSNVEAALAYGIPAVGTMAHSYVLAFADEIAAFRAYAAAYPERCVLLVDTYDSLQGVENAVRVAVEMRARGAALAGIRLDSGDLLTLARQARRRLDAAGCTTVRILASGGLDEYGIAALVAGGAPIDAFGVGTNLGAPPDAPSLDLVYKLVEYEGRPVAKRSPGKMTSPGRQQVWRRQRRGKAVADRVSLLHEEPQGRGLLVEVVREGRRVVAPVDLETARRDCAAWLAEIPGACRRLRAPRRFPVRSSRALAALRRKLAAGR